MLFRSVIVCIAHFPCCVCRLVSIDVVMYQTCELFTERVKGFPTGVSWSGPMSNNYQPVGAVAIGNWKAKRNGRIAEMLATILYDTVISANAVIDGQYQGRPLEVTACQQWVADVNNSNSRGRGRFWIAQKQQKELLEGDGFYAFFVLDEHGDYLVSKLVSDRKSVV